MVFLKCLLCYYCSKKEISSALSRGSQGSLGGHRDAAFPLSEANMQLKRKSWDSSGLLIATCKLVAIIGSTLPSCCLLLNGWSKEELLLSPVGLWDSRKIPQSDCRLDSSEVTSKTPESPQISLNVSQLLQSEKTQKATLKMQPATSK